MAAETVHFLEACALERPVLVTPEHARMVMEVYLAADLSAERNAAIDLPCEKTRSGSASRSSARAA
jgi:myo-inositol 2-dehydrogenase/D-chiro-inositol 1-dehydrogenase